ncbi:MAG TPA: flagellar basal-body rod protein FlgG [Tepidisphaeraceae bacterium]|nr:flagellar basal-body rod protein FlgG [Tepidisphaeraceae bacterium]
MAILALNSAATGLKALSTQIDVVANNLANAETTAFKRSRTNFEDLMYLTLKQPGTTNASGEVSPAGISVGLGVAVSNTQIDTALGSPETTGRNLDVMIEGPGFFAVKILDSIGNGVAYTRNGNFFVNSNEELVLGMGDGYKLVPPITIPRDATEVSITQDGQIFVLRPGQVEKQRVGEIEVTMFVNPQGLRLLGGSLYQSTEASGNPINARPGEGGSGLLRQAFLESSNVDPVKELVTLIKTQRAFELNSQSIQTADQALQTIGNLRRM